MRIIVCAVLFGLVPALAHADFVFEPAPPPPSPPESPPAVSARPVPPPRPAVPMAVGFGREVPLRLAVMQIVPAGWTARYGAGVDRDRPVDWSGGKAWPDVLRATVRPIGLRVAFSGTTVTIAAGS